MKTLNKKTVAYAIARLVHGRGTVTKDVCIEAMGHVDKRHVERTLQRMCDAGQLTMTQGVHSLAPDLKKHFDADHTANITPPPYRREFSEWSGKYDMTAAVRRHDAGPPRDVHFHYVGNIAEPAGGQSGDR
ncbi:MAG: hypothetical protein ACREX0_06040 [Noviherbaspirillum sp.]